MEALVAFGIACNVMQTIKFTIETADGVKKLFRGGSANPELSQFVNRSVDVYTRLEHSFNQFRPQKVEEYELAGMAEDCLASSNKLRAELLKLVRPTARGSLIRSMVGGFRVKMSEGKIQELKRDMQNYQKVLELGLLARVW